MTWITYATRGTAYEDKVEDLIASADDRGITIHTLIREDLGSYNANTCQKPIVMLEAFDRFGPPIIWVDADCTIEQTPRLLLQPPELADWSAHLRDGWPARNPRNRMRSTVMAFWTQRSRQLLTTWIDYLDEDNWDQNSLWKALGVLAASEATYDTLTRHQLPLSYVWVSGGKDPDVEGGPVIRAARRSEWHPQGMKTH